MSKLAGQLTSADSKFAGYLKENKIDPIRVVNASTQIEKLTVDDRNMRAGKWIRHVTIPVRGQTLGIVGLGRIGKAMALRALAFGMHVVAFEVAPDHAWLKSHAVKLTTLEELLKQSDVVSLHAPATAETKHLMNSKTLALMKPTAFLLNTARGGLVDETDLAEALRSGKLAGAGLDVFAQEPTPPDHPFYHLDNVVMTPHTGGTDLKSRLDMAELAAQSIVDLSQGKWPAQLVVMKPNVLQTRQPVETGRWRGVRRGQT